jgi:hypothetical protein
MKQKHQENRDEYLDKAGQAILRAVCASDEETNSVAGAPFLYAGIRDRMAEHKRNPPVPFYQSLMMFSVVRYALPVLAIIAILAVGSYRFIGRTEPLKNYVVDNTRLIENTVPLTIQDPHAPVTACSITSRTECVVSTDDVVALLVNSNERQK